MGMIIASLIILSVIDLVIVFEMSRQLSVAKINKTIAAVVGAVYVAVYVINALLFYSVIVFIAIRIVILFAFSFMYKIALRERLIAIITYLILSVVAEFLVSTLVAFIVGVQVDNITQNYVNFSLGAITTKFAVYTNVRVFFKLIFKNRTANTTKINLLNLIMPIATLLTIFLITLMSYYITDDVIGIISIFISVLLTIANIASFIIYENNVSAEIKAEQEKNEKFMLSESKKGLVSLIDGQMQANREIHEFKNKIFALRQMMLADSVDAAGFIDEMCDIYTSKELVAYTTISDVDVLLNSKMHNAKEKGVLLSYFIIINDISNIDSMDLCMILGNLLDNALTHSTLTPIKLAITTHGKYISIKCENAVNTIDLQDTEAPQNTDNLQHGYGLKRIADIAEKYNGSFKSLIENGKFIASVLLKNA